MGQVISIFEEKTGRRCFDAYRRCLDHERASLIEYDDLEREFMKEQGETILYKTARDISNIAEQWQERKPAIKLFLDGSRRTYKIADIPIGTQVFPIIAGQVGVGVCNHAIH